MPIIVPKSFLDDLIAESMKRDGLLTEVPPNAFTITDVRQKLADMQSNVTASDTTARRWIKKNAIYLGRVGNTKFYAAKQQNRK